jgi:putative hydrolase of the HAD superfamily
MASTDRLKLITDTVRGRRDRPEDVMESTDMIVVFDLFGVIARDQSDAGKERLAAIADVAGQQFQDAYWALRPAYDRGEMTGPEYWRGVARILDLTVDLGQIDRLIEADLDSWRTVDADMVTLLETLVASGRRIALLSNIPEELATYYEEHQSWTRLFAVRGFSCRIHVAKPDPEAFRWCCRALDVEPSRILFVDDRTENIAAAEAIGMRGHHFTDLGRLQIALRRLAAA